jgi:hypothetical protein
LAEAIMPQFDTLSAPVELGATEVLTFDQPVTVGATLPGGLLFLRQHAPGDGNGSWDECGDGSDSGARAGATLRQLVTFPTITRTANGGSAAAEADAKRPGGGEVQFCAVGIDKYQRISSVAVLASSDPLSDLSNLTHMYGTHEKFFNNLVARFDEGLVPNLLQFFRAPSVLACFHDRFADFVDEVAESVRGHPSVKTAEYETMVRKLAEAQRASASTGNSTGEAFSTHPEAAKAAQLLVETPQTKKLVKDRLIDYLTFNAYHLPMYARPGTY